MVPFTKASACGNDFLVIDGMYAPADLYEFSRRICDRHNGIGADGVEWLFPAQDADMRARLINADGSEAEISGNGTRCVAAYMVSNGHKEKLSIRTGAGVKQCELVAVEDNRFEFEMDMGEPLVGDDFSIKVAFGQVDGIPVSLGNRKDHQAAGIAQGRQDRSDRASQQLQPRRLQSRFRAAAADGLRAGLF